MVDNNDTYGVAPNWGGPNYSAGTFGGNDMPYGTGWNNYAANAPFPGTGYTGGNVDGRAGGSRPHPGYGGGPAAHDGNPGPGAYWSGVPAGAYGYEPYVSGAGNAAAPPGTWGNAAGSYGTGGSSGYWPGWGYGQPNFRQPQYHLSDQQIEQQISDALDSHPVTANADIDVAVQDHAVTLTGRVKGRQAKMLAEDIAWNSPGVDDVHNQVQVTGRRAAQSA
ncbi:MAG TPA: BON domain-containing protein [Chloroflexota bacterium]|nr:BON domain-containing protein [Chloroflexota bacterium]